MKTVLIIGATGSLGTHAFNYFYQNKKFYKVTALIGWNNEIKLEQMKNQTKARTASKKSWWKIKSIILNHHYDIIINCVGGITGIKYTWLSLSQTKTLVLANKESLFIHGKELLIQAKKNNTSIIPLDSELTTLWYLLNKIKFSKRSDKVAIMASGGVLRNKKKFMLTKEVFNHPVWTMGKQITVDSSTMINKIYEWYAASIFFKKNIKEIQVFINLQGNVHAAIYQHEQWYSLFSKPKMPLIIKMIFENSKKLSYLSKIKDYLEEINLEFYPLFAKKTELIKTKQHRICLLTQSILQGSLFIRGLITYPKMIKNIYLNVKIS